MWWLNSLPGLSSPKKELRYLLNRRPCGLQSWPGLQKKRKSLVVAGFQTPDLVVSNGSRSVI